MPAEKQAPKVGYMLSFNCWSLIIPWVAIRKMTAWSQDKREQTKKWLRERGWKVMFHTVVQLTVRPRFRRWREWARINSWKFLMQLNRTSANRLPKWMVNRLVRLKGYFFQRLDFSLPERILDHFIFKLGSADPQYLIFWRYCLKQ